MAPTRTASRSKTDDAPDSQPRPLADSPVGASVSARSSASIGVPIEPRAAPSSEGSVNARRRGPTRRPVCEGSHHHAATAGPCPHLRQLQAGTRVRCSGADPGRRSRSASEVDHPGRRGGRRRAGVAWAATGCEYLGWRPGGSTRTCAEMALRCAQIGAGYERVRPMDAGEERQSRARWLVSGRCALARRPWALA